MLPSGTDLSALASTVSFLQATSDNQTTSGKTGSVSFTQTGGSVNSRGIANNLTNGKTGYNPFYQWGRKDAFRSAEYTADPAEGTCLIYKAESVTVGTSIKTPTTFYGDTNPYASSFYYNAWNATYTTGSTATTSSEGLDSVVKTVYDPCPVGYTVSPANTFIGLSLSNAPESGMGRLYTVGGKQLYFPYAGQRWYGSGALWDNSNTSGPLWVAVTTTTGNSRTVSMNSGAANPAYITGGITRCYGDSIRPVREN